MEQQHKRLNSIQARYEIDSNSNKVNEKLITDNNPKRTPNL